MDLYNIFDITQIVFWSVTYVLMIGYGVKYRYEGKPFIPLLPGCLNLAWEINAGLEGWLLGSILWLVLDLVIFIQNMKILKNNRKRILYICALIAVTGILYFVFRIPEADGKLYSVFIIDIIMAVFFIVKVNYLSQHGRIAIACTKLIGDLFAWIVYSKDSTAVSIIGLLVLLLNIMYLAVCLEKQSKTKIKRKVAGNERNH